MKLSFILFFSQSGFNDTLCRLLDNLALMDIKTFWNPECRDIPSLPVNESLVVTDTAAGASFAAAHQIPFIEKWDDNAISDSCFKPVCYYDQIDQLTYEYLNNQWRRSHHLPLTIAKTKRLSLTELTLEDYPVLYQIRQNKNIAAMLPPLDKLETELEKHRHYITYQYEFFDYGLWGIYLKNGELIGQAGIQNHEYHGQSVLELSYFISAEHQRNGYATEAILAIYHYVVSNLEQNQLIAIIAKNNLASIKTAMNLGMKRCEETVHEGFSCHYYRIDNIQDFLVCYASEQKRKSAAKSALRNAIKHPVQDVYTKYKK